MGLLGPSLGLSPTGGVLRGSEEYEDYTLDNEPLESLTDPFTDSHQVSPTNPLITYLYCTQCCCFPVSQVCPDPFGTNSDLSSLGIVSTSTPPSDHHQLNPQDGLVFRFSPLELISTTDCSENQRSCCYDVDINLENFAISCLSPSQSQVTIYHIHISHLFTLSTSTGFTTTILCLG